MMQALLVLPAKIAQHVLLESTNRHQEMHCARAVRRILTRLSAVLTSQTVCANKGMLVLMAKHA